MAIIGRAEVEITANTDKFDRQLKSKVQAAAAKSRPTLTPEIKPKGFEAFDKVIDSANNKLKGFGLNLRDFSQFASTTGIALAAVAVGKFAVDAVQAAAALGEAQNLVTVTFGESADAVLKFAETAPQVLGTTQTAALNAAGQIGQLGKSFGFTEEAAAKLGTTVVRIATDISSLRNVPVERVQQAIESAFAGESEPLRRLGVDTRETRLEMIALDEGLIQAGESMTSATRAAAVLAAVQRDAGDAFGDFANTADSLPNLLRTMNAQVDELKIQLGQALLPEVVNAVGSLNDLLVVFQALNGIIPTTGDAIGFLADKIPGLSGAAEDLEKKMGGALGLKDLLPGSFARRTIGLIADVLRGTSGETENLATSIEDLIDTSKDLPLTAENLAAIKDQLPSIRSEIDKITDAREALNDAIEDGEERVDEAERRLVKTIQDNERRVADAEKSLVEARQDSAKDILDAHRDVTDAIRERDENIADAQRRRDDTVLQAHKRVADAREALDRERLDSKERLAAAEEAVDEARIQKLEQVTDAQISLEEAQFAGDARAENRARRELGDAQRDKSVQQAQKNLLGEQEESQERLTDLEKNLAEERKEARRDIQDAERDLSQTIRDEDRKVADSKERLAEAEIEAAERVGEAQQRLADAERQQAEQVAEAQRDRLKAIDDTNEKVAEAREKLLEAAGATGDWAERLKVLNDQLQRLNELLLISASTGSISDLTLLNDLGRAEGGPVTAGGFNLVGERGPELVRWGASGTVVSNADIVAAIRELGGNTRSGAAVKMNIVSNQADARVIANELSFLLMQGVTS